nr:MobA/MobL family protein [Telmatospirillum siberiense]
MAAQRERWQVVSAIYHCKVRSLSRAAGQSAVPASAYRRCANMTDERTGQPAPYARKRGHLAGGLVGWDGEAEGLWNTAEAAEKRRDAKVAREVVVALPAGLPLADQEALVRGFAEALARRHGIAVQWDIHAPSRAGDQRNVHAHLLLTTRRVVAGRRLSEKTRELDVKQTSGQHLRAWRRDWEGLVNAALERAGSTKRVDCRSHAQRHQDEGRTGPAPEPMTHLGPARTALERRGRRTRAGARNDRLAEAARLEKQLAGLDRQLTHLRRQDRPSRARWHLGRAAGATGRLAAWSTGATVATVLRLAGVRVRRPRLPTRAAGTLVSSSAGLAAEAGRAVARAIRRWRARRQVPPEVRAWWRAVVRQQATADTDALRREAFRALASRYPDHGARMGALRAASAALPRRWRLRLAEADQAAKAARLAAVSRPATAVDRAADALAAAARGRAPTMPSTGPTVPSTGRTMPTVPSTMPSTGPTVPSTGRTMPTVRRRADRPDDWPRPVARPVDAARRRGKTKADGSKGDEAR